MTETPKPKARKPRPTGKATKEPQPKTKKQLLIGKLKAKGGADLAALTQVTGWQAHTVRAALTRLKAEGHELVREPGTDGKPSRYRIVAQPSAAPVGSEATE